MFMPNPSFDVILADRMHKSLANAGHNNPGVTATPTFHIINAKFIYKFIKYACAFICYIIPVQSNLKFIYFMTFASLVLNLGSRNLRQLNPSLRMMTARANTAAQSFLVLARERLARSPAAVWHDVSDDCVHRGAGGGDGS